MNDVESMIDDMPEPHKSVLLFFHRWLTDEFGLTDKLRFKIPFYYRQSWICYLNPIKKGGVEFAFVRGHELADHKGILDNKGRKQVFGAEFTNVDEMPIKELGEIIHEAILLDETVRYASKRKRIDLIE